MKGNRVSNAARAGQNRPSLKWAGLFAAISAGLAAALWLSGLLVPVERSLQAAFFSMESRSASGELVVVEMDAVSLAAIRRWPWDRVHYANLIDRLDEQGARSIAFDVDLSARSDPRSDARLARSVAAARSQIILPTFSQRAAHGSSRVLDALPIAPLRDAANLASVSVVPDSDGQVRRMPLGTVTAQTARPSLSAQIAQRAGTADESFPIDLSIDAASIPRLSFVAVERGEFDPALIAGKDVLIGATAVEMGDRYAVPGYGVLPGVIIQAMASETLRRGIPRETGGLLPLLLSVVAGLWIARAVSRSQIAARASLGALGLLFAWHVCWSEFLVLITVTPSLVALATISAIRLLAIMRAEQVHRWTHDSDTGLPNKQAMKQAGSAKFIIAASIANFDRMQAVLGEDGCAELVLKLAQRIAANIGDATVYRVEDRVLAWYAIGTERAPEAVLPALGPIMKQPVEVHGRQVDAQIAFGVAVESSISEAALAASQAARLGQAWHYHEAAEKAVIEQQLSLMGELDAAISLEHLEVVYQPKLHLASNRIDSVEALVRWNHPERGYLRPDLFIPMAEEGDRIADLTLFVLRRTIRDLSAWCAQGLVLTAAVNISARLLSSPNFLRAANALLHETGVPRSRLIFEVTESAAFLDAEDATEALRSFHALGVGISIDDYGTGQSTLSYLKRLPLSELKIDRSFVQFSHRDRSDALLVRSTLNLAHELGLRVVAEGVEEAECLDFLKSIGCDYAQGYLVSRPIPPDALASLLMTELPIAA